MNPQKKNTLVFIGTLVLLGGLAGLILFIRATRVPSEVVEITANNFKDEVIDSKIPVFMEFYVPEDCEPCKEQAPIIEKLAQDYKGKVRFVRIDALKFSSLSQELGIKTVPTHLLLDPTTLSGKMKSGLTDEAKLREFIDKWLDEMANPPAPPADPNATPPSNDPPAAPNAPGTTPAPPANPTEKDKTPTQPAATPTENDKTPTPPTATPTENDKTPTPPAATPTENDKTPTPPAATPTEDDKTPIPPAATPTEDDKTPIPPAATPTEDDK
ncbi:MAG: conjugal transfer protein TraF, partial [Candidatus Obscuribacterales bacterium]|nr:conjugal transfer protein TraF [Candidatus Obscuribacterales bacterium]